MSRHINDAGLALIKGFESLRLLAYRAPEGHWTIGWGRCNPDIHEGMRITMAEANDFLKGDLEAFEALVCRAVKVSPSLNDNQFSALVCFAYNVRKFADTGLVKLLNSGKTDWAVKEWVTYNKARVKGKMVQEPGLTRRRQAEVSLFLTPISE